MNHHNLFSISFARAKLRHWAPVLLRIVMGYGFIDHGWAKLSHGTANFEHLVAQIGAPFPHLTAWIVPSIELVGGLALLLGAFVELFTLPLIGVMLVAIFTVHFKYGFSSIRTIGLTPNGPVFAPPGYEVALLYIAGLVCLAIVGAGAFSLESLVSKKHRFTAPSPSLAKAEGG